ncbi:NADH-quinone oxidoreductase subunit N [Archaeoglobus veneficus]|uniref:NADH/Ubiquinone/plastoquinone (Complex I) n=1 Tax=Archaeoglobus veneficus (strain DSM 11195 / SNP6) TaxID=693661 RepID=F2KQB8_ARCVS|nr:NADH-quinone oxidoreductase subunit N [Archaeoglobus veneficus]AEA46551.1 NADH/Ubiquinone/plastoquinone (complex I) [Archaeoglobus veneficus SNP6]
MEPIIIASILLLTVGAAVSLKSVKGSILACVAALAMTLLTPSIDVFLYALFVVVIALLNISSLTVRQNQITGVDYSLVALIAVATVYIAYTNNPAFILAAFVLASVPTYVLIMVGDRANVNVAIKYITFMVLATVLFLIGALLLVYTSYYPNETLYVLGFVMLILGLGMEVGCAPMHEWVPDVFAAADPLPLSVIASITKIVPFVAAYKILLLTASPLFSQLAIFIAFVAVISMFTGNIGALTAKETSRILAYSTVANMGYVLATLVVLSNSTYLYLAFAGALMQLIVNAAGKASLFTSIKVNGASTPLMYLIALSFIGLPPLMGFWSKFFILTSLVGAGFVWLAFLLVVNSAISIPYYLRVAKNLAVPTFPGRVTTIALVASVIMLITVVPPNWFVEMASTLIGGV